MNQSKENKVSKERINELRKRYDSFVEAHEDSLRYLSEEEKEIYEFLHVMERTRYRGDLGDERFPVKQVQIDEDGRIYFNGLELDTEGEPTKELKVAIWELTKPEVRRPLDAETRVALSFKLLDLIYAYTQFDEDEPNERLKIMIANVASVAALCFANYWDEDLIEYALDLERDAPVTIIKPMLLKSVKVAIEIARSSPYQF